MPALCMSIEWLTLHECVVTHAALYKLNSSQKDPRLLLCDLQEKLIQVSS